MRSFLILNALLINHCHIYTAVCITDNSLICLLTHTSVFVVFARVRQSYDLNWTQPIPSPLDLNNGTKHWKGVSTTAAHFDHYLKQLAKVPMTKNETIEMLSSQMDSFEMRISPTPFKVFIYTIEQLDDNNTHSQLQFEKDIQQFLNLKIPLKHFASLKKENVNDGAYHYPEYINICESQYKSIRNTLIEHGEKSSLWIRNNFIKSSDVVVSDVTFFDSAVRTWSKDPCDKG